MHKRYLVTFIVSISVILGIIPRPAGAIAQDVVISQVQIGNISSSRLIELFNTSDDPVDVTDWCVYHSSASGVTQKKLVCFDSINPQTHVILSGLSYTLMGSSELGIVSDFQIDSGLGGVTGGHIYIQDSYGVERDRIGWGTAIQPETAVINFDGTNLQHVLERKTSALGVYIDTDDNSADFKNSVLRPIYQIGAISEVNDICSNVDGIQSLIPDGYYRDVDGLCQPEPIDICLNIDGLQVTLPDGYVLDDSGACLPDICTNLSGIQAQLPLGYKLTLDGDCMLDLLPVKITELLANPYGSDVGKEFIELYNPNDIAVDLGLYMFKIGIITPKLYSFPAGSRIEPNSYVTFFGSDIPFILVNTSSKVALMTADGVVIDETPIYNDSKDDAAWALLDGAWQYTNQSTPGTGNIPSFIESDETIATSLLAPCASNQYRNLETNRCRLLALASSVLAPCKDGQYRSEETNRCRSIAADATSVTSCNENQERNLTTNRCRLIAAAETELSACKDGQERNLETNRCRNVISNVPLSSFAVEPIVDTPGTFVGWWALGGVGMFALAYGAWEWRTEITQATQKLRSFFHFKK